MRSRDLDTYTPKATGWKTRRIERPAAESITESLESLMGRECSVGMEAASSTHEDADAETFEDYQIDGVFIE